VAIRAGDCAAAEPDFLTRGRPLAMMIAPLVALFALREGSDNYITRRSSERPENAGLLDQKFSAPLTANWGTH